MSKKEDFQNSFGTLIAESVGPRPTTPAPLPQTKPNPYVGYRSNKKHGELEIDRIIPDPNQPRKMFDEQKLNELSESIRTRGVLQPIRVRWEESSGKWIIITGETRWRASKLAGKTTIPCILIEEHLTDEEIRIEQLVENCQRTDLRPLEQAIALQSLSEKTNWSTRRLAEELALSKATVVRSLALLKLTPEVQSRLANKELTASVAYALSKIGNDDQQRKLATTIARRSLSREAALQLIERETTDEPKDTNPTVTRQFKTQFGTVTLRIDRDHNNQETIKQALEAVLAKLS